MTEERTEKPYTVAVATVGCRANQADSASLARYLDHRYVAVTTAFDQADMVIINTCCVTAEAERDCRKLARRALKASSGARVVLAGCAVTAMEGFGDGIDPRIETRGGRAADPRQLADWILDLAGAPRDGLSCAHPVEPLAGRTRALLKIQTGCRHGCAYCIVPKARGPEHSMPLDEVLMEIDRLSALGSGEVVITGVQLGAWGKDLPGRPRLAEVVTRAADRFAPGRLRLSSIEPWSVDDALIEVVRDHDRVCPHLHLPLQNGDDGVLRDMKRGYTATEFLNVIDKVRTAVPDVAIGTDVILGFPGETDRAFQNTVDSLKSMAPSYLHAFSYSPRPHTVAARLPDRPDRSLVRERTREIRKLGDHFAEVYRMAHLGRTREIIIEEAYRGRWRGLTDTFVKVALPDGEFTPGQLLRVALGAAEEDGRLTGSPLPSADESPLL